MPEIRSAVKLDFTTGLDSLPSKPKADAATTQASVAAGRQLGFSGRTQGPILDGRRLRSRGANTQLNLKVTPDEKDLILREAARMISDPTSPVLNIGEFVVLAVRYYGANASTASAKP